MFERALVNLRKFEWRGAPFVAWLFRIAANAIVDRQQAAARDVQEPPAAHALRQAAEKVDRPGRGDGAVVVERRLGPRHVVASALRQSPISRRRRWGS